METLLDYCIAGNLRGVKTFKAEQYLSVRRMNCTDTSTSQQDSYYSDYITIEILTNLSAAEISCSSSTFVF